ncbi:MAG: MFS transporter [Candidatus Lokiarchaeota archaeon]|nr:MFS transporter [Candidatus Lokiarchaeota archaeon]
MKKNMFDTKRLKRNQWKLYLFEVFIWFHLISGVLIPFFLNWGKLQFVEIMYLQSYFTMMIMVFEIPCGAVSDYISRKFSLLLGGISNIVAVLIYISYANIVIFFIGETFWALSAAFISGTDESLLFDTLKKLNQEHLISKKSAKLQTAMLVGIGISAPIGSLIGATISLPAVVLFMVFPFALATIISATIVEPNHYERKEEEKQTYIKLIKSGFLALKANKTLRILALEFISVDALVFFILWTYQLYLEQIGVALTFYGVISAAMTVTQMIILNLIPKVEKKYPNKKLFIQLYTLIPATAFILMAFISYIPLSVALILIVIGFGFSRKILFVNGINFQIESVNRATILSTINMAGSLLRAVLYPLIGYLVMWNLNYTFIILGIMILILVAVSRIKNEYI